MKNNKTILQHLAKPMRKTLSIEQFKKEQNFKPINKKAFLKKLDALEIEAPIEDLIGII